MSAGSKTSYAVMRNSCDTAVLDASANGERKASQPLSEFWLAMSELQALHQRIGTEHMREISALRRISQDRCPDQEYLLDDSSVPSEGKIFFEEDICIDAGPCKGSALQKKASRASFASFSSECCEGITLVVDDGCEVTEVHNYDDEVGERTATFGETQSEKLAAKSSSQAYQTQFSMSLQAQMRSMWVVPEIVQIAVPEWSSMSQAGEEDAEESQPPLDFSILRTGKKQLRKTAGRLIFHSVRSLPHHYLQTDKQKWPRCLIHPQSPFKIAFDLLGTAVMLYDFVMIPLQFFQLPKTQFSMVMEWLTRIFWVLDIWINFHTATFIKGVMATDYGSIAKQYFKTMFVLDFIIVLADWCSFIIEETSASGKHPSLENIVLLRMVKGLRFAKVMRIFKLERIIAEFKAQINSTYFLLLLRPIVLTVGLLFFNHMLACFWYGVGRSSKTGWTSKETEETSTTYLYFTSLHWAISQLHGNVDVYPQNAEERLFQCSTTIIALVMFSTFLSSITNAMAQIHALREDRFTQETQLREVLSRRHVSAELTARIKKRWDYTLMKRIESDAYIIDRLPRDLATDLLCESRAPMVEHHQYFFLLGYRCPRVLRQLCFDAMAESNPEVQETLFTPGDVCLGMFFVEQGELSYQSSITSSLWRSIQDGSRKMKSTPSHHSSHSNISLDSESHTLTRKSCICEAVLWMTWQYHGELTAITQAQVLSINAERFGEVVQQYHFAHINSARYASSFLSRMLLQGRYTDLAPPEEYSNVN